LSHKEYYTPTEQDEITIIIDALDSETERVLGKPDKLGIEKVITKKTPCIFNGCHLDIIVICYYISDVDINGKNYWKFIKSSLEPKSFGITA